MPKDMGPIRENKIDVLVLVDVPDMAPFPFFYKGRSPSYGLKGPDRAADSPGEQLAAFAKQFIRFAQEALLGFHWDRDNCDDLRFRSRKTCVFDELMKT